MPTLDSIPTYRPHFDTKALLLADTTLGYTSGATCYTVAEGDVITADGQQFTVAASGASDHDETTAGGVKLYYSADESIVIACGDETTAATAATGVRTFRMPYKFRLTAVRASLVTAQTSGNIFTVDINEGGTTILSTKLTIDNGESTSTTAATAAVISDATLADDAQITIDVDQIGDGTAAGLKVTLIGAKTS